jgi:hypothetical protein
MILVMQLCVVCKVLNVISSILLLHPFMYEPGLSGKLLQQAWQVWYIYLQAPFPAYVWSGCA